MNKMRRDKCGEPVRLAHARAVFTCSVFAWMTLCAAIFLPVPATAENHEVTVQRNEAAKMRDGVTLRADIYRPKAEGKFPVLLVRTPYDKRNETNFGLKGAARGFVVIAQDVRGRFESEGEWYTFVRGARETAAPGGDLSERDGVELSRRLDVSGRGL